MARIRTIKPEFWTDEDMAEVSEPACLLAIGLLNYADDEGYFNANPKLIKAAVFPIREPSVPISGTNTGAFQLWLFIHVFHP
ncbi:primosomal protein I [Klebsiella pneumoniae subsp. rhinoscleromatis]|nr:primosomal protein I [Klebsiella pneumoniae subsp. rhinoscleromatis]